MFFLALKLVKLFVKGIVWLVKLPIRITMKLAGVANSNDGGRSTSQTSTNTRTRSRTGSAGATQSVSGGSADQQPATGGAAGTSAAAMDAVPHETYQRFRHSLLAFAVLSVLSPLWLIVSTDLLAYGFGGEFLIGMVIGSAIPVGLWYWTRQRSRLAWGVAMAYAVLQLLLSLGGTSALAVAVPGGSAFGQQPVFTLLQFASLAALAAVLYFGATGRDAVGQPVTTPAEPAGTRSAQPADNTAASEQQGAATNATGRESEPTAEPERTTASTAEPAQPPSDPATTASASEASPSGDGSVSATEATTAEASTGDEAAGDGETETTDTDGSTSGDAAEGTADETDQVTATDTEQTTGEDERVESLVDELWSEPADPETVRELGETVSADNPSEEIVETLERCSRADDPETRVAVCEVCDELDGPEPESILERLRIDTNDRVATTAMDAL